MIQDETMEEEPMKDGIHGVVEVHSLDDDPKKSDWAEAHVHAEEAVGRNNNGQVAEAAEAEKNEVESIPVLT